MTTINTQSTNLIDTEKTQVGMPLVRVVILALSIASAGWFAGSYVSGLNAKIDRLETKISELSIQIQNLSQRVMHE